MQGGRRRPGCPFVGFALCAVERILADSTVRVYLRHMSPEETNPSGVSRYAENCEFHGTAKSGLDAERRISGRLSAIRLGVLAYNILVILWGAYVRASGSGAGCGDHWPLCNGQVVPRAPRIETMIEYSHRLTSGLSFIVVVGLCAWRYSCFSARQSRSKAGRRLGRVSVRRGDARSGAGPFQRRPDRVHRPHVYLSAHLANTLLLLAALVLTAWFAEGPEARLRLREMPWPFWAALPLAMLVCVTGTVAALGDTAFPSASLSAGIRQDFSPTASFLVRLRMFHPFVAAISRPALRGDSGFRAARHRAAEDACLGHDDRHCDFRPTLRGRAESGSARACLDADSASVSGGYRLDRTGPVCGGSSAADQRCLFAVKQS